MLALLLIFGCILIFTFVLVHVLVDDVIWLIVCIVASTVLTVEGGLTPHTLDTMTNRHDHMASMVRTHVLHCITQLNVLNICMFACIGV